MRAHHILRNTKGRSCIQAGEPRPHGLFHISEQIQDFNNSSDFGPEDKISQIYICTDPNF